MHGTYIKTANIFAWTSCYFVTSASRFYVARVMKSSVGNFSESLVLAYVGTEYCNQLWLYSEFEFWEVIQFRENECALSVETCTSDLTGN
jgi:hypothetical protein